MNAGRRAAARIGLALVPLLVVLSCHGTGRPEEAVGKALDGRDEAVSNRNLDAFAAAVADDFLYDPSAPRTERERIARYLDDWPSFAMKSEDRVVRVDGDQAQVLQRVRIAGADSGGTVRLRFTGPERLTLTRRDGGGR